ncbi:GntR family transcriptional regulator [Nonomuraea sp. NPDC050404]|uniref:GntR family transcriptional regulator n=1 Tax=Nonomuraea sp. NPDC050404 TaxID=3155783 RepID=UPI003404D27E
MTGYSAGSMLPSESALCAEFGIARNTVRRALAVLENEGLIQTIPSKGRLILGGDRPTDRPYLYQAIAHDLRKQIEDGGLAAGVALPSGTTLRRQYQVSRGTIQRALRLLERSGLIERGLGRRTFVRR